MVVYVQSCAARDVPAESRRAAALDRAHHLELAKAHMPGMGAAPRRSVIAEDVRDLQPWTGHDDLALRGRLMLRSQQGEPIERAHDGADRGGGDTGVERSGLEFGMPEQDLDHANVDVLFQQMRGEAMPERVRASRAW